MTSTLIIIPAAYRDTLNALIASHPAFPAGTAQEFSVPLFAASDPDEVTPTHYWLDHRFTPEQRAVIDAMHASFPLAVIADYEFPSPTGFPHQKLDELGLKTKTSTMEM